MTTDDHTADDAVERAADAIARARGYVRGACLDEHYRDAHATLAAAGAGAEVDRGACPHCPDGHADPTTRPWGVFVAEERDGDGQPAHLVVQPSNGAHVAEADAEWLRTLLAARGDATPTEVEWGVRESNGVETHYGSGTTAEVAARRILAIADGFTLIQRTVSAWREVEGGETT